MKKLMLLVPLCLCVIAGMVMSGCGSSDIINIPAAITSLAISDGSGDIPFTFTYVDNPDVTGTFIVEYILATDLATDSWTAANVIEDLTDHAPGNHAFTWDAGAVINGTNDYVFRVRVDKTDAVPDIPDVNMKDIHVTD